MKKYSLTNNTKTWYGITLFQIKAEISFGSVVKGELGGYIEKEDNKLYQAVTQGSSIFIQLFRVLA